MPSETRRRLTAQRINADPNLSGPAPVGLKWSPDGRRITYLKPKPENDEVLDLWAYDVAAGRHAPLVRTEELVPPDQIEVGAQEAARRAFARGRTWKRMPRRCALDPSTRRRWGRSKGSWAGKR